MRALMIGALSILLAACGKEAPAPAARPPVEVSVLTVTPQDAPAVFEFVGQTESSQQVEIRARVSGFLERRTYTEGSPVKAGQVLFVMDKKPFEAALSAARAEVSEQEARLTVARQNLARIKPLAAQNALSQKDLDDATGQEQSAAAALEAARAKVIDAELNLSYCTITSPVDGLSSFAKQQNGSYIDPQNSLLTYVARLSPMRVNFSLSENEILRLRDDQNTGKLKLPPRANMEVEIVLADGSHYPTRGRITFADAAFSQETGTYLVRADMDNAQGSLRPGQFVRVHLLGAVRPGSFVLPQRAVQQGPRGEFVWVAGQGDKAEQRAVTVGDWLGDSWVIRDGLHPNERVVVDGTLKIAPDAQLKITAATPASGSSSGTSANPASAQAGTGMAATPAPTPQAATGMATAGAADSTTLSGVPNSTTAGAALSGSSEERAVVRFASSSAVFNAESTKPLADIAARLIASPQSRVTLTGYTDRSGNPAQNAKLALARAEAVRNALYVAGVKEAQVDMRAPVAITGSGSDEEARRVELAITTH